MKIRLFQSLLRYTLKLLQLALICMADCINAESYSLKRNSLFLHAIRFRLDPLKNEDRLQNRSNKLTIR